MLHVALCADFRVFRASLVLVRSISQLNGACDVHFHLVHDGSVAAEDLEDLRSVVSALFPRGALTAYRRLWPHGYSGINPYVSRATMLRLLLPHVLREQSRAIYLDLDVVVYLDLHELWAAETGRKGIAMRPELAAGGPCSRIYEVSPSQGRISGNAGVMVLDLALLRSGGFVDFCVARSLGANDQSLINDWCGGAYALLPAHCNLFQAFEAAEALERYRRGEGFVLHYNGLPKPWEDSAGRASWLWRRLALGDDARALEVVAEASLAAPSLPAGQP